MPYQQSPAPAHPARSFPQYTPVGTLTGRTPRPAQDTRLLTITFQVAEKHAPSFKSAIEEIQSTVATRVEGKHEFKTEDSLTYALVGLGSLRAALNKLVPAGDPDFKGKR